MDKPNLISLLPTYYSNSRLMKSIQNTNTEELGTLRFVMDEILRQMFVSTASWGLELWEKELGLAVNPSKTDERRKELIMAALRGVGTTTASMLVNASAAFSGGEVEVVEFPSEYRFEIRFVGIIGVPTNITGFMSMIEAIKPAHLRVDYVLRYNTYGSFNGLHFYEALKQKTYRQLKEEALFLGTNTHQDWSSKTHGQLETLTHRELSGG